MQFSEDFTYLYINNDDGSITGVPVSSLTEEEKQEVYRAVAKERYA